MKNILLLILNLALIALISCSTHNPDSVLNPESDFFDSTMAQDANGNQIADGLEPYLSECDDDLDCAAQRALEDRIAALSSSQEQSSIALSSQDNSSEDQSSSSTEQDPISSSTPNSSGTSSSSEIQSSSQMQSSSVNQSSSAQSSAVNSSSSVAQSSSVAPSSIAQSSSSVVLSSSVVVSSSTVQSSSSTLAPRSVTTTRALILNNQLATGSFTPGTEVRVVPRVGGMDLCVGTWTFTNGLDVSLSGDTITFTMPNQNVSLSNGVPCVGSYTDIRNGQVYPYEQLEIDLGGSTPIETNWLMKNMNYNAQSGNEFCYDNDPANCTTYGLLYRFTPAQTACPTGWRIPTYREMLAAAPSLELQLTGRGTAGTTPTFSYLEETNRHAYWVSAVAGNQNFSKNCSPSTQGADCGYILTDENGTWQIASDNKEKSYPVRCIQIY